MLFSRLRLLVLAAAMSLTVPAGSAFAQTVKKTAKQTEVTPDNSKEPANGKDAQVKRDFEDAKSRKVRFHMDFDKVDILEVIKAISQWTKKNFILPDNVRGKITIIGPTDVTADEAFNAFVSSLEANNLTPCPIPRSSFYKILPKKDCIRGSPPTDLTGHPETLPLNEQMATRLFRLKYSDADPIKNVIQQFITREGEIVSYPPDVLIVSDNASNLNRVDRFIKALDIPGSQDEVNVVQVVHSNAQELSATLLQIFQAQGGQGAPAGGRRAQLAMPAGSVTPAQPKVEGSATVASSDNSANATVSKIIPDERTNKLIVIASARAFVRINELIKKLDVPTDSSQIHVYYLANADAEEVASVLSNLAQGTSGGGGRKRGSAAAGAAAAPVAAAAAGGGGAALFSGEVKVTADKSTNSLLITASPSDYRNMIRVIDQLDVRRRQVFIEAVIMEVKLNAEQKQSVDFHTGYGITNVQVPGTDSGTAPILIGSEPSGGATSLSLTGLASLSGFLAGIQGPPIKVEGLNITLPSFGVVLNALQKNSDVNVISTPHILTSDNNEAEIAVGSNVPFQTAVPSFGGLGTLGSLAGTATGTGTSSALGSLGLGTLGLGLGGFTPIQRQPVELRLKIKPHVNESDFIKLEIDEQVEEISSIDPQKGPTTAKRAVKTTVVAKDQSTVVIGGLIQERTTRAEAKTPILGSIPIISFFFRNTSEVKERTNLLLFLTPYVIRDQSDFRAIFERKMKERQEFVARFFGTSEQYAVTVDYDRKKGPLSIIRDSVREEFSKAENGGAGGKNERVIMGTPPEETTTPPAGTTEPGANGTTVTPSEPTPSPEIEEQEPRPSPAPEGD
jgi:general secretion pathway protein D